MMKKLSEDHYIVMDDSEITTGDIVAEKLLTGKYELFTIHTLNDIDKSTQKKIIYSTQPESLGVGWMQSVQPLLLSEIKELLGAVDVHKKACAFTKEIGGTHEQRLAYIDGYKEALEDNKEKKYTNEDMLTIRNKLVTILPVGNVAAWDMIQAVSKYTKWFDEYVESLQPKTEWEVEFVDGKLKLKS